MLYWKGFWACVWDKWCQLAYLCWEEDGFSGSTMGHILDTLPHFSFRENGRWPITTSQFSATKAALLIRQLEATQRSQLLIFFLSLPHPFYINMWKCKRQSGIRCEDERLLKEGLTMRNTMKDLRDFHPFFIKNLLAQNKSNVLSSRSLVIGTRITKNKTIRKLQKE